MGMMKAYTVCLTVALVATSYCSAIPPKSPEEHKNRVYQKDLSDADHELNGQHNNDYDHEAFLGEEAESFDQLSPEESRRRLGIIVDKIDKDKDGFVTEEELKTWIEYVQSRYIVQDTDRMWADHQISDNVLKWESYKNRTYGYFDEDDDLTASYRDMILRDERRWKEADRNQDGHLSKEEFMDFLHPEEVEHMRDIVVQETIEDIDKNKDGYISLEEYIADIYDEDDEEDEDDGDDHKEEGEPEWVRTEREQFGATRDKDQDGRLDKDEVRKWIIPEDYNYVDAEAKHLMQASDEDQDGKLSKEEILDKSDIFVGSQATEFGEALVRHDEF